MEPKMYKTVSEPADILNSSVKEQRVGEVEKISDRISMAIANVRTEYSMLASRLDNVIAHEPINKEVDGADKIGMATELGNKLAHSLDEIDALASNIRYLREHLEN